MVGNQAQAAREGKEAFPTLPLSLLLEMANCKGGGGGGNNLQNVNSLKFCNDKERKKGTIVFICLNMFVVSN